VNVRQERSAAIVAALFDLWEKELPRLSGKSKLAEAIRYATSRRTAPERSRATVASTSTPTRRAGDQAADHHEKSGCSLAATAVAGPGNHRHAAADREDE
jgi:hypothetical protein